MKKILATILISFGLLTTTYAQSALFQGGTGWSTSTKGDLLVGTTSNQRYTRLPVGSTGNVLWVLNGQPAWVATSSLGFSGSGTVTSVSVTTPTGLTASTSTCTTACVIALSLTGGYIIPLTASTTEWATAYASTTNITPSWIRSLFSNTATGLTYNSSTGGTSLTSGYVIPLTASTTEWSSFYSTPSTRITAGANCSWAGNTFNCTGGSGGTFSTTSINGLATTTFTFSTSSDTNITLSIATSSSGLTFIPGWSGVLSTSRGGTGTSTPAQQGYVLVGLADGTWSPQPTSTLGISGSLTGGTTGYLTYWTSPTTVSGIATGSPGTLLQASSTSATGYQWVSTSSLGIVGGGGVSGSGITDYVTRWSSPTAITTGKFIDNGTVTGVNATSSLYTFNVQGDSATNPFNVASSTGTSLMSIDQSGRFLVGTTTNQYTSMAVIDAGYSSSSNEGINIFGNKNSYFEGNIFNLSNGTGSQACWTSTNNSGSLTSGFISMCANNTNFNDPQTYNTGGGGDTSIMSLSSGDFILNNATSGRNIFIVNGGSATTTNTAISINSLNTTRIWKGLADSTNATGTQGQVLLSTGTSTLWTSTSSLGISGSLSGGTNGLLARWTSPTTLSTGISIDNGTVAGFNATTSTTTLFVIGSGTLNPLNVSSSTGASILTVSATSRVGLGTTTPTTLLSLAQHTTASGGINFGDASANLYRSGSNTIKTDGTLFVTSGVFTGSVTGTISGASSGNNVQISSNSLTTTSNQVNLLSLSGSSFAPSSGSATYNMLAVGFGQSVSPASVAQTGSASGITRGIFISPTITSARDFRAFEIDAYNATSSISTVNYGAIFNAATYSSSTVRTASSSHNVMILGAAKAGKNLTVSTSSALSVIGGNVVGVGSGTTTTAYSIFTSAPTGATYNWAFASNGKLTVATSSPTPTLSSCGTSPSIRGSDWAGVVTVGSSATGCTITFASAYPSEPSCTLTNQSMSVVNAMTYTVSTTAITVTQTGLGGSKLNYHCVGLE